MSLKQFLADLTAPERHAFAARVGTSFGHLRNIGYGISPCAPKLAVRIAAVTAGRITRQMLCPDDYWEIWPDLPPPPGVAGAWFAVLPTSSAVPPNRRKGVRGLVADKRAQPVGSVGG